MAAKVRKKSEPTKRWTRFFCFTCWTRLPFHLPSAIINVTHQSLAMFFFKLLVILAYFC